MKTLTKSQQGNCNRNVMRLIRAIDALQGQYPGGYVRGADNPKSVMIDAGKSVLRYLAKALELEDYKVWHNAGGTAVSGEVMLSGAFYEGKGLYISISASGILPENIMWRVTNGMNDKGYNRWLNLTALENWSMMVETFNREAYND